MTKTVHIAISAAAILMLYIFLTFMIIFSPELGLVWQVGLASYFIIGIILSLAQLTRLSDRENVIEDLEEIEQQVSIKHEETFKYIRKHLK